MAGFHVRSAGNWRPVVPSAREQLCLDGCILFTPGIDGLIALCDLFGRPKDAARKRLLDVFRRLRRAEASRPGALEMRR